ncbi:MAG: winged helix-turn-helix transcriptional regulator [Verrucomicrobia bacterium]|nr:winged helix-turn-helix transcriptional regulator [Verrucomicrobiota bacterium]
MTPPQPLRPTLWRTCRVIANPTRLQIFALLAEQSGQTVSGVAERLKLPLSEASESLRALEARGLLTARREGRYVKYEMTRADSKASTQGLAAALRSSLRRGPKPQETIFKLATAFTHPRRIEIFRILKSGPRTFGQITTATGISGRALLRHLRKLESRGFVECRLDRYSVVQRFDVFGRELARMTAG